MDLQTQASDRWLAMVTEFHDKFGHPVTGGRGKVLSETRRAARGAWLIEELSEFVSSWDLISQVDSCLDFLYFCWGNFVEIGKMPQGLDLEFPQNNNLLCPSKMSFNHRVSFASRASESVYEFMHSDTQRGQRDFSADSARVMLRCLKVMGVDPRGLMAIVQESNMGKLWADGKPRYGPDSKISKPVLWAPPEPDLGKELNRRVLAWDKENKDEIPF